MSYQHLPEGSADPSHDARTAAIGARLKGFRPMIKGVWELETSGNNNTKASPRRPDLSAPGHSSCSCHHQPLLQVLRLGPLQIEPRDAVAQPPPRKYQRPAGAAAAQNTTKCRISLSVGHQTLQLSQAHVTTHQLLQRLEPAKPSPEAADHSRPWHPTVLTAPPPPTPGNTHPSARNPGGRWSPPVESPDADCPGCSRSRPQRR